MDAIKTPECIPYEDLKNILYEKSYDIATRMVEQEKQNDEAEYEMLRKKGLFDKTIVPCYFDKESKKYVYNYTDEEWQKLMSSYMRLYKPPAGKVVIDWFTPLVSYSWPQPHLIDADQAIERFCALNFNRQKWETSWAETKDYYTREGRELDEVACKIRSLLTRVARCPCMQEKCVAELKRIKIMNLQMDLFQNMRPELNEKIYESF